MLEWIDQVARQERPGALLLQQLRTRKLRELADHLPLGELDRLATGTTKSYWQDWLSTDPDFWGRHSFAAGPAKVTAAIAMIAGWHDIFLPAQLRDYAALRAAGHEPRLTIGPWRHADNDAAAFWVREGMEFLRAELGGPRAGPPQSPVRIFVTGSEQWRELPGWPPASSGQTWYLQPDGGLAASARVYHDPAHLSAIVLPVAG